MARKRNIALCGTPDGKTALYCPRCGEAFPFPIGVIDFVAGVCKAFDKAHQECQAGETHSRTGLQPLPGVSEGLPLERAKEAPRG